MHRKVPPERNAYMNILILQEAPERARNAEYCVAQNLARAFNRRGVVADVWGPGYRGPDFKTIIADKTIALITDNYPTSNWMPDLSDVYSVFYSIDSHIAFEQHLKFCKDHSIDRVLCATKSDVVKFSSQGFKCDWFPLAYPSDLIQPLGISRCNPIGFCGSKGTHERFEWIQKLHNDLDMKFDEMKLGPDMVSAINSYKVGFNKNMTKDINARVFETCGCGTMLLTNSVEDICELFDTSNEIVTYKSYEDCLEKAFYYIKHDAERCRIAARGYEAVKTRHTYDERVGWFCENL